MNFKKRVIEQTIKFTCFSILLIIMATCFFAFKDANNVGSETTTSGETIVAQKIKQDILVCNKSLNEDEANILAKKITTTANNVGVSPELLACLFKQESQYNQEIENELGATGLGQITPVCEEHLNNQGHQINRYDRDNNILGSAIYLKEMLEMFDGNERLALAAYNAGPGVVSYYGDVPPYGETQHYVKSIMLHKEKVFS